MEKHCRGKTKELHPRQDSRQRSTENRPPDRSQRNDDYFVLEGTSGTTKVQPIARERRRYDTPCVVLKFNRIQKGKFVIDIGSNVSIIREKLIKGL